MHHVADHQDAPASSASAFATLRDPRGLACSTRSSAAVQQVEAALESMLSYFGDPLAALDRAIEEDPAWPHPRVLKAAVLLTLAEFGPAEQAREILRSTPEAPATGRERAHRAAAQAAADGDWDLACRRWEVLLAEHPRDIAALLFAHLFDFYRGDALNLKRRPQRVLPAWSPELPLYGYVLGMQAFGLEEAGHYAQAEDAGQAALAHNPRDPWAVHAVTHVYEMQGRHDQGTGWLASREADWAPDNGFAFHNWFHAALFQLERLDTQGALATYDAHLAPPADMALQRVDATAILWRLKLLGADVADRFEALRRTWSTQPPDSGFYAFNDVHALLAHLGARTEVHGAECKRLLQALQDGPSSGPSNRTMAQSVGLPLAQALMHYAQGRWDDAADGLMAVRDGAHRFGGSHAQRDILTLTLLDAATRAGRTKLAAHVLNERCPDKAATPLTSHWRERIGERAGAVA
jgi:tetratricopeptide (TPR) repeat protein